MWYFPRGHGHMLECLGNEPSHFILIFDNGYFSEFGTFSITDWIGHTPKPLLAKNFGLPESAFDGFPKEEVYFARGKKPPEEPATAAAGLETAAANAQIAACWPSRRTASTRGAASGGSILRDFEISKTITGVILDLDPGGLRELHWHPNADEWQYVIEGNISVTMFGSHGRYRTETMEKGDVGYIPQGYGHSIENVGNKPCRVLIGFNTGIYETIDLSQWIAGNPTDVLATNFGKPAVAVREVPQEGRVYRRQGWVGKKARGTNPAMLLADVRGRKGGACRGCEIFAITGARAESPAKAAKTETFVIARARGPRDCTEPARMSTWSPDSSSFKGWMRCVSE